MTKRMNWTVAGNIPHWTCGLHIKAFSIINQPLLNWIHSLLKKKKKGQKLHLHCNRPAARQQQANGTSGCEILSPRKQELLRPYVSSFTAVCLSRESARRLACYDFKRHALPANIKVHQRVCSAFCAPNSLRAFYQRTNTLSRCQLSFGTMAHWENPNIYMIIVKKNPKK